MKILIGVSIGMLLGGGGVWAFHDQRPLESYQSPVTPLVQSSTSQESHRTDATTATPDCRVPVNLKIFSKIHGTVHWPTDDVLEYRAGQQAGTVSSFDEIC